MRIRASRAAEMREKRERLRSHGICIVCHKTPTNGKSICSSCSAAARLRTVAMRQRRREERHKRPDIRFFEKEGDSANLRFAYAQAAKLYERAATYDDSPKSKLWLKIVISHLCSARPELADPWLDRLLTKGMSSKTGRDMLPYVLRHKAHLKHLQLRGKEAIPILIRACQVMGTLDVPE